MAYVKLPDANPVHSHRSAVTSTLETQKHNVKELRKGLLLIPLNNLFAHQVRRCKLCSSVLHTDRALSASLLSTVYRNKIQLDLNNVIKTFYFSFPLLERPQRLLERGIWEDLKSLLAGLGRSVSEAEPSNQPRPHRGCLHFS